MTSAAGTPAMAAAVTCLEQCFRQVQRQRMGDVPLLNPALRVAGVGFRPWQDFWLGVLVAPWFINLVLLPTAKSAAALPEVGTKLTFALPAGSFTFIAGREDITGPFLTCSLLSPVFEVQTQRQAEDLAREALRAIMQTERGAAAGSAGTLTRRGFFTRLATTAPADGAVDTAADSEGNP